jgi:hypothetical protein
MYKSAILERRIFLLYIIANTTNKSDSVELQEYKVRFDLIKIYIF